MAPKLATVTIVALICSFAMTLPEANVIPMRILTTPKSGHSALLRDESFHKNDLDTDMKMAAKHFFEKRDSGGVISSCTVPNTVAVTFDDGPFKYTSDLLDFLDRENVKVTFFLNGLNRGDIWQYVGVVKRAFNAGHQIGSHTWSHMDLGTASESDVQEQMTHRKSLFIASLFTLFDFGF